MVSISHLTSVNVKIFSSLVTALWHAACMCSRLPFSSSLRLLCSHKFTPLPTLSPVMGPDQQSSHGWLDAIAMENWGAGLHNYYHHQHNNYNNRMCLVWNTLPQPDSIPARIFALIFKTSISSSSQIQTPIPIPHSRTGMGFDLIWPSVGFDVKVQE